MSTRLSPVCCERLASHHAIPILLFLIQSCNRSQPHMEVLRLALNVLRNLALCDKTVTKVRPTRADARRGPGAGTDVFAVPRVVHAHVGAQLFETTDVIEVLSELMQIFRDSTDIFVRSLQVLAILAAEPSRLAVLKRKHPKEVSRLKAVVTLVEQRHNSARTMPRPVGSSSTAAAAAAAAREQSARSAELLAAATQLKKLLRDV